MRKLLINCLIALFLISSLFIAQTTFAQTATESAKNNYQLPYPGLLPDNPLYSLKALRDKLIEFLISDPIKKAEFDLLSADKRLSIGIVLFEKKKQDLSENTISKGENYLEEGIKNLETAKKEGRQIEIGLLSNYDRSVRKHKEILEGLSQKSSRELKQKFAKDLKRIEKFSQMLSKLSL